jgi:RNA polymerase sigma factor (sigma-70 family)
LAHAGFLRALARNLLYDQGQAEDVVQETYLAALRRPPPAPPRLGAWLAGVTRNLARKRMRTDVRRLRREEEAARAEPLPAADDAVARLELHRLLVDAVQGLDEPYRAAIVHRYFEERPPREIARRLGVPVRTVETRLRRAIERLRHELDAVHGGDRRAWCLALVTLVPVARPSAGAALLTGVIMSKVQLVLVVAAAAVCFLAGWSLKPGGGARARATRDDAPAAVAAVDPDKVRLEQELATARARLSELEERLRAPAAREEKGGGGEPSAEPEAAKGPRFLFPEYEQTLLAIDWEAVGTSTANLAPLLAELLDSLEKTGKMPANVGDIQRWNGPLVTVAVQLAEAGMSGTGVNGAFSHPAVEANIIHATLKAGDHALSADQEARLEELGRRYAAEEARRLAAYPEGTLALRKLADEATLKDRFFGEVDALLTQEQRDLLHPESVRGYTQLDLFSSGIVTYLEVRPLDMNDREAAVKRLTDKHYEKLDLDAAYRPAVEAAMRRYAERVAEAGLDAPREKTALPGLMRSERVRKAAQLQLELWADLERSVPLTPDQKRRLSEETNILVPFR